MRRSGKLSKEERKKLKAMEQERKQREAEEKRLKVQEQETEENARLEEEFAIKTKEKMRLQDKWKKQLYKTKHILDKLAKDMVKIDDILKEEEEWERLMRCDGLPDPKSVPELNRYLSLWRADSPSATLEGCFDKTPEVIHVVAELEKVIEEAENATEKQHVHWKEIWLALQEAQREKLNEATYEQLLDLRPHIDHETMVYAFVKTAKLISLALWCNTNRSPKNNLHHVSK